MHLLWLCVVLAGCEQVFSLERLDAPPDAPLPVERWRTIAGGTTHSCGIRVDQSLWCWGRNDFGQLGLGSLQSDIERNEPAQVGGDLDWESVSIGNETTCAIKTDHSLWCWGRNQYAQVGDGSKETRLTPVAVAGRWLAVSNGWDHTCAIDDERALFCWGANFKKQLGAGTADALVPQRVSGVGSWQRVRAGESSTCGIQTDQSLWCWGSNDLGRLGLGNGAPAEIMIPARVGTDAWTEIAMKSQTVCALRDTGVLRCWGENTHGAIGDRTTAHRNVPTPVDDDRVTDWKAVEVGWDHTCAIRSTGELQCWGRNEHGQLVSDLSRPMRPLPTAVEGGDAPWAALGLGRRHTCAIDTSGELWCAGYAASGALGFGEGSRRTPTVVGGSWERPITGEDATCAYPRGQSVLACWGSNRQGLLGDGAMVDRKAPGPTPTMTQGFTSADLGDHGCAIDPAMRRWCWGANDAGQLGTGVIDAGAKTPVQIGLTLWLQLSSSRSHTCGVTAVGVLECWGRNAERQTGHPGTLADPNAPIPAPNPLADTPWTTVSTGIDFSCGHRSDKVYCWGHNGFGQLGAVSSTTHLPVEVVGLPKVTTLVSGARHTCALSTETGSASCWGWNAYGQLGEGTTASRATPIVLPGTWRMLALGEFHSCGIRADSTLACWGRNHHGQLGDGSTRDQIDPATVGTDTDWVSVALGYRHTCAAKADGQLQCWGANEDGAIGDGTAWRAILERVTR